MISPEEAVQKAAEYQERLYTGAGYWDLLLEEIEQSADGKDWKVTLGFNVTETEPPTALDKMLARTNLTGLPQERKRVTRKYKIFYIDAESGEVKSMKASLL